jgi:hemerythrin
MAVLQWTEEMSVGVPELDADHKELIKVINQLAESSEDAARGTAIRQCLFALLRYAEYHFAREEKVLAACHYPEVREHKLEHRDFVARVNDLHRRFDDNPDDALAVVNDELLNFLRDWLNHHILIEDMAYRAHAERNPAAREAARSFKATEVWWSR